MTPEEFKAIRKRLGLTQRTLAHLLGYADLSAISAFEREAFRRPVPYHTALLMEALDAGFWPASWYSKEPADEPRVAPAPETKRRRRLLGDQHADARQPAEAGIDQIRGRGSRPATGDAALRPGRP